MHCTSRCDHCGRACSCIVYITSLQALMGVSTRVLHRFIVERECVSARDLATSTPPPLTPVVDVCVRLRERRVAQSNSRVSKLYVRFLGWCVDRLLDVRVSFVHRWLGKLLLLVAVAQIWLGLQRFSTDVRCVPGWERRNPLPGMRRMVAQTRLTPPLC